MNYFIIPGNPPALYFYEEWKSEILREFPRARVRVCAYPNLAFTRDSQTFMRQVLDFQLEQLIKFHRETASPVTVLGHSLGGYFSLGLLQSRPDLVSSVFLLFPFLRRPSGRGRMILRAMRYLHNRLLVQKLALSSRHILGKFATPLGQVSDEELLISMNLAGHEHQTISRDTSALEIPPEFRNRIRLLHSAGDTWCTDEVVRSLREQILTRLSPVPHDFVVEPVHRASLLAEIRDFERA